MHVSYKSFKGHDGEYELGRACLLQGENDTGKSSLVAALHFGLTAKIAAMRMGKGDTQDPGRLLKAIDDGGWAEVTLDGTTVRRVLEATAKKARIHTYCDGLEGAEAEAAAARLSGDLLFADFRRLVAAGDKERADILATYLPQPDDAEKRRWALGQMVCHMEAALKPQKRGKKIVPALAGRMTKEQATGAREALLSLANANHCRGAVDAVFTHVGALKGKDTEDFVKQMRLIANEADQARKDAEKVAKEAAKDTVDIDLAKEIPKLEKQVNALRSVSEQAGDAQKAVDAWHKRDAFLTERGKTIGIELAEVKVVAAGLDEAKAKAEGDRQSVEKAHHGRPERPELKDRQALADQLKPLANQVTRLGDLADRLEDHREALAGADAAIARQKGKEPVAPEGELGTMRGQKADLDTQVAGWKAEGKAKKEQLDAARAGTCVINKGQCPLDWSEFIDSMVESLNELAAKIREASLGATELGKQIDELEQANEAYHERRTTWVREHMACEESVRTAGAALAESEAAAAKLPGVKKEMAPVARELELLVLANNEYEAKFSSWTEGVSLAQQSLKIAQEVLDDAGQAVKRSAELDRDLKHVSDELRELQANQPVGMAADGLDDLAGLEDRLREAHAARGRLDVLGRLDVDALTVAATMLKAAHKGAAAGLMACVQAATEPVVGKINEALARMDVPGEFYVDLAAKTFGLIEVGKHVDVEVLGGGKAVLFAAAMLSALPPKGGVRVLTLEGAELHPKWLGRLLKGLDIEAFDAVVVASCHDAVDVPDGWSVINMGE